VRSSGGRVACRSGSPAAAQWYEQRGYIAEAIRHPQAARDWPRAGRLLAHNYVDLISDDRLATVRELNAFPDDVAAADAALAHILAAVHLLAGGREESAGCRESSGLL
jgi:LuxR family transcriptional regulator, maltose regulon positive regulatory protein